VTHLGTLTEQPLRSDDDDVDIEADVVAVVVGGIDVVIDFGLKIVLIKICITIERRKFLLSSPTVLRLRKFEFYMIHDILCSYIYNNEGSFEYEYLDIESAIKKCIILAITNDETGRSDNQFWILRKMIIDLLMFPNSSEILIAQFLY
jgi:hypothetical protein